MSAADTPTTARLAPVLVFSRRQAPIEAASKSLCEVTQDLQCLEVNHPDAFKAVVHLIQSVMDHQDGGAR